MNTPIASDPFCRCSMLLHYVSRYVLHYALL